MISCVISLGDLGNLISLVIVTYQVIIHIVILLIPLLADRDCYNAVLHNNAYSKKCLLLLNTW